MSAKIEHLLLVFEPLLSANVVILAGSACSGKTERLLASYREKLFHSASNSSILRPPQSLWIVSNLTLLAQLRDRLVATSPTENSTPRSILNPALYTFTSFAQSIIARSDHFIRPISPIQKRRLLHHTIQAVKARGHLQHFAAVADTPGFVSQVDETIAALKRADSWPEAFQQWCDSRPRSDLRNRELARLYVAYQGELQRLNLYDAEGRFWAAREILSQSRADKHRRYELVVFSGFNDFTTAQLDILRLLQQRSDKMQFALTVEAESDHPDSVDTLVFSKPRNTLNRLQELFSSLEIQQLADSPAPEGSLRDLQQHALRETTVSNTGKTEFSNAQIIAAASELGELEFIAQQIKTMLVEGRAQAEEMIVVHRGDEKNQACLASVFRDYGIPVWSEASSRLESEPLVRALSSLLRLIEEDWPFHALLDVIGNRLFRCWDEDNESMDLSFRRRVAIESVLRSTQLPAGKKTLLEQLEYRANQTANDQPGLANQRRDRQLLIAFDSLRHLDSRLEALPAEASIELWLTSLEQLLQQLGVFHSVTARSPEADTWRQLRKALRKVEQLDVMLGSSSKLKLAELQSLLANVTRTQRVASVQEPTGCVRVLSAETARKLSVEHLFLAGLNEQSFAEAQNSSVEIETASEASAPTEMLDVSANEAGRSDSMLLFYELITRPTQSLTLSYPALDSKGQPLTPTPLLNDLQRSLAPRTICERQLSLGQAAEPGDQAVSVGDFRRQAIVRALDSDASWLAGMISHPTYVRAGSAVLSGVEGVAQRSKREGFSEFEGLITSPAAQSALSQRFDAEHLWSPSRLEGYAACPFRFFSEQLLGLQPLNELTLQNDARRRGSLLHQVLATIHEQLSQSTDQDATADELIERFMEALDQLIKASPLRGINQSLQEIERREIEAWVPSYAEQEIDYRAQWQHLDVPPRPAHFEVRFGPKAHSSQDDSDQASMAVPFELDLGDERIRLTGQIDRVDIGCVGDVRVFNIIDYKSGREVKLKHEKVCSGHQLQLPLYALAAERLLLAEQNAVALATGYWNIQGKGFQTKKGGSLIVRELAQGQLQSSADWRRLEPEILQRVQGIIREIRQGHFPVYNEDEQCTRSCELSTICRVAQIRSLEKVWPPVEDEKAAGKTAEVDDE